MIPVRLAGPRLHLFPALGTGCDPTDQVAEKFAPRPA